MSRFLGTINHPDDLVNKKYVDDSINQVKESVTPPYDDTALKSLIDNKQNKLTQGDNIIISGNVISAKDTVYDSTNVDNHISDSSIHVTLEDKNKWNDKQNYLGFTPEDVSKKSQPGGYASLDEQGKIPSSELPSYVDDVIEESDLSSFPVSGESGKIYIASDTNKSYRWSGTSYVEISSSLALGTTSSTAFRGDYGNIAYQHSLKTSENPHNVTKEDIGLGNVDNTSDLDKPISKETQLALDNKADKEHEHSNYAQKTETQSIISEIRYIKDESIKGLEDRFRLLDNRTYGLPEDLSTISLKTDPIILTEEQKVELKGDKGDPFVYEDFTPEQLDDLRLKYEDLTPEQIEDINKGVEVDLTSYAKLVDLENYVEASELETYLADIDLEKYATVESLGNYATVESLSEYSKVDHTHDEYANKSDVDNHTTSTSNPHNVTKSQVGLGSVQNYGLASLEQAIDGTMNTRYMTPHRTMIAIDSRLTGYMKQGDPITLTEAQKAELKGDKGDPGPQGPQGLRGLTGETGAKGDKGDSITVWTGTQSSYNSIYTKDPNTFYVITG